MVSELNRKLEGLRHEKPKNYEVFSFSAATARSNVEVAAAGDSISIEHYPSASPFFIRLNEPGNDLIDLSRLRRIDFPFYRFFLTNVAGNGNIVLNIGRGLRLESEGIGLEELAVRLGSIDNFDQRGQVILLDDFQYDVVNWSAVYYVSTGSFARSSEFWKSKGYSAKIATGTTVSSGVEITRRLPYPVLSNFGFEYSYASASSYGGDSFWVYKLVTKILIYDGEYSTTFEVDYFPGNPWAEEPETPILQYLNSNNVLTNLSDVVYISNTSYIFNVIKLVVDFANTKYRRIILNNTEINLSQFASYRAISSTAPQIRILIGIWAGAVAVDGTSMVWVDNVIVTHKEP